MSFSKIWIPDSRCFRHGSSFHKGVYSYSDFLAQGSPCLNKSCELQMAYERARRFLGWPCKEALFQGSIRAEYGCETVNAVRSSPKGDGSTWVRLADGVRLQVFP